MKARLLGTGYNTRYSGLTAAEPQKETRMQIIAFDSHKRYTQVCVEEANGKRICEQRIMHQRGNIKKFLSHYQTGLPVAIETIGNWYWLVDEIEDAGMKPRLVHARKAKLMIGAINKTDKLDARGLNLLQRCGTLPTVWIPPGELRDKRELPRVRMTLASQRTRLKNRILSVMAKYGLQGEFEEVSDSFGTSGRKILDKCLKLLPEQTLFTTEILLNELDRVKDKMDQIEIRMREVFEETPQVKLLDSLPGVGFILAVVISQEIGDISRFGGPEQFASYCGTCPRVHSSGDKTRYGKQRTDVNQYLKWAYCEAANQVAVQGKNWRSRHCGILYNRLKHRRGHGKAIGAVARHFAEASYWMLNKNEEYKEPQARNVLPKAV
jgi:transposase